MERAIRTDIYMGQPVRRRNPGTPAGRCYPASGNRNAKRSRKRMLRRKAILVLWIYFGIVGMITTCILLIGLLFGGKGKVHAADVFSEKFGIGEETAEDFPDNGELTDLIHEEATETSQVRQACHTLYEEQGALLVLVNKERELSRDYQPGLRNICNGRLQAADILYEDLCAMLQAAGREGYEYWIASAYRSRDYQQGLVDEDVEKYMTKGFSYEEALRKTYEYTMPAGQSEHETGLALDILCSTNTEMDESQEREPGNLWLQEHCQEYGFILRYPKNKEEITKIEYEPWHFRYVGKEAAKLLTENNLTLEEYYEMLEL